MATETFEQDEADIIVRMLWYCSDAPRAGSQISSYCGIDRSGLLRFSQHCIARGLLKMVPPDDGLVYLETTEHGKQVLKTALNVMRELGIEVKTDR